MLDIRSWDWQPARIAAIVLLIATVCWLIGWRDPTRHAEADCREMYRQARSHADTVRVDAAGGNQGARSGPWNCGMLRKAGRL